MRLGITDWWIAQDIDNAVAYRLLEFDNESRLEQMKASAKLIAYEVSKMFGGDDDGGSPYADAETEQW